MSETVIFKGKWRSRDLKSSNFSGLAGAAPQGRRGQGASRPARPRRLKAGAARISAYRIKLLRFMGNALAHWGQEQRGPPSKCTRGATRPYSCSRRPTHLRRARATDLGCSLACFHFFFRELPLLTRPHLTQPLLLRQLERALFHRHTTSALPLRGKTFAQSAVS